MTDEGLMIPPSLLFEPEGVGADLPDCYSEPKGIDRSTSYQLSLRSQR